MSLCPFRWSQDISTQRCGKCMHMTNQSLRHSLNEDGDLHRGHEMHATPPAWNLNHRKQFILAGRLCRRGLHKARMLEGKSEILHFPRSERGDADLRGAINYFLSLDDVPVYTPVYPPQAHQSLLSHRMRIEWPAARTRRLSSTRWRRCRCRTSGLIVHGSTGKPTI